MKIIIDKEKLEARIAELEEDKKLNQSNMPVLCSLVFELHQILQQGEEYNENELTFLRTEVIRLMKESKDNMVIFEEEANKVIADNENEAVEFAEWLAKNYTQTFNERFQTVWVDRQDRFLGYPTEDVYKKWKEENK